MCGTHKALPQDFVIEDLELQNKYLQEKLHALEKQFSKDAYSRPSEHKDKEEKELGEKEKGKGDTAEGADSEAHTPVQRSSTSEMKSEDHGQREQDLQKENRRLSSENIELKLQLEQANKDVPRLKNQVRDLKEV
ncbi:Centrosomal protein of 290 kDa [Manis javanica]|nr:Centrosomal protein of 290 kDa [Manis javanica]